MQAFDFDDFEYFLSTREQRGPTDDIAEEAIRNALESRNLPYAIDEGGGAFYGPKLDINLHDAIGRKWQLGTVQVDFVLPERFDLKYRGSDGADHRPVMIHRALAGSMERFFGVLIEHFGGASRPGSRRCKRSSRRSPSISSTTRTKSRRKLRARRLPRRASTSPTKSSATRSATGRRRRFPYILVVGKTEAADGTVNVNERGIEAKRTVPIDAFAAELRALVDARR